MKTCRPLPASSKRVLTSLARMAMDLVWAQTGKNARGEGQDGTLRFAHGVLPEALLEPVTQIHAQASGLSKVLEALGVDVKAVAKDDSSPRPCCARQLYAQAGRSGAAPGQSGVHQRNCCWSMESSPWPSGCRSRANSGFLTVTAHACPIVPGDLLRQFLWSQVRGAIVTIGLAHQLRQL